MEDDQKDIELIDKNVQNQNQSKYEILTPNNEISTSKGNNQTGNVHHVNTKIDTKYFKNKNVLNEFD